MDHLKILKDSGLTIREISKILELGERTVQLYLSGKRDIPAPTRKLIEYEFGKKSTVEPAKNDPMVQYRIVQSKEKIKLKDEIIALLRKRVQDLEAKSDLLQFQLKQAINGPEEEE